MLAGQITKPCRIELIDIAESTLPEEPGQILFQPELACLCGSDLPYFDGQLSQEPHQIGHSLHEMIGTVIDTSGNRVEVLNNETGRLQEVGELNDAAFLYVGGSVGYWLYQNGTAQTTFSRRGRRLIKQTVHAHDHWITGFAPLVEVQFNRSLEKSDTVDTGNIRIQSFDQFSLTNLVLGGLMTFGNGGSLTVAWVKPVIGNDDRQFDDEIRVAVDWSL